MFLTNAPVIEYPEPWTESFSDRLQRLEQGSRHVAYFYDEPDTSTFRYRVTNMIEALEETDASVGASWFSGDELSHLNAIVKRADVIVISRSKYSVGVAHLVVRARSYKKRVLYDIDDLVFDDRYAHLVMNTLDRPASETEFDYWFARLGRHGALLRLCDGVIVTNEYLAERVREFCDLPTAIVPNFMNRAQLNYSARILDNKRSSGFVRDRHIHIGYFSGSPTHSRDFAIIADALLGLMDADPRIVLRIVGVLDPGKRFTRFGDRVEVFPLQNILNLQRLIGEVEINVVPLQDNAFTNCKSELKVFEASAVGTVSIASPSYTLRRAIRDGETGFIASAHRWRQALDLATDRLENYPSMAMAAAESALRRFTPAIHGAAVIRALFGDLVSE
jgi:glycosyltransferase involved in cell wall biosynthesis